MALSCGQKTANGTPRTQERKYTAKSWNASLSLAQVWSLWFSRGNERTKCEPALHILATWLSLRSCKSVQRDNFRSHCLCCQTLSSWQTSFSFPLNISLAFLSPLQPGDSWESLHQNLMKKLPISQKNSSWVSSGPHDRRQKLFPGAGRLKSSMKGGKNKTATRVPHIIEDLCLPKCISPLHIKRSLDPFSELWNGFLINISGGGRNTVSLFTLLVTKGTVGESGCRNGGDSDTTATQEWEWIEASHCDLWQALWFLWSLLCCVTKTGCWKPALRGC